MNSTFLFQDEYLEEKKRMKEGKNTEREKSHLPFSHCERIIRDQIKNLFSREWSKRRNIM